jgi:PTS system glucose-specific IIC component
MAATSFFLMNIFGAHVGMTFSGGFIDAVIYGMIPMAKGTE